MFVANRRIRPLLLLGVTMVTWVVAAEPDNHYAPYPAIVTPEQGIAWPSGQAMPTFASPSETLDAIDVRSLTRDECIAFASLQGLVNRRKPRIYLLDSRSEQGRDTWAETATVGLGTRTLYVEDKKYELIAKYLPELSGVVLYDTRRSDHYRNLAGTVAGLQRAVPVTKTVYDRLRELGDAPEIVADLTSLEWTSPVKIYQYLYDQYWRDCEKRILISARPDTRGGDHHHTRDLAAACGAAVVWLDNRVPEQRDMMRKFLADMPVGNAVVLGWYTSERSGITTASEFGIGTLPADFYSNATVHSGIDHTIRIPRVPKMPELENKAYVAIFISDGDNIQYTQRAMRRIWDQSAASRGRVALNWTIAPGLVDIGPGLLNYYYTSATPLDCFVTGPSGMGYMMPYNTLQEPGAAVGPYLESQEHMDGYARLTETYLQRSGLRVATIWDDMTPMQRASYEKFCRTLYGATVHNFKDVPSVRGSVERDRLRFERLVIPYATTYEHIHRSLQRELRHWDGDRPLFLAYQVAIWKEMKPDKVVELEQELSQSHPGQIQFVRADHYFNLYQQSEGRSYNLMLSDDTKVRAAADASPDTLTAIMDGSPTTVWNAPQARDLDVLFDFGTVCRIRRYIIRHGSASGSPSYENMRDYIVQTSVDGRTWQLLASYQDNPRNVVDAEFSAIDARFFRVKVKPPSSHQPACLADVEVYGHPVSGSAEPR